MSRVWLEATARRTVEMFDTLDDAQRDARLRGACQVIDAHFRFWSTPTELTLLEAHSQIFRRLCAELDEPPHPADVVIRTSPAFGRPPQLLDPPPTSAA